MTKHYSGETPFFLVLALPSYGYIIQWTLPKQTTFTKICLLLASHKDTFVVHSKHTHAYTLCSSVHMLVSAKVLVDSFQRKEVQHRDELVYFVQMIRNPNSRKPSNNYVHSVPLCSSFIGVVISARPFITIQKHKTAHLLLCLFTVELKKTLKKVKSR